MMQHAGLDESQAGMKMARRNIDNLRCADDTILMAESRAPQAAWTAPVSGRCWGIGPGSEPPSGRCVLARALELAPGSSVLLSGPSGLRRSRTTVLCSFWLPDTSGALGATPGPLTQGTSFLGALLMGQTSLCKHLAQLGEAHGGTGRGCLASAV